MAEALIAAGCAAQARAVLARLGAAPGGSAAQAPAPGPPGPARRTDAS